MDCPRMVAGADQRAWVRWSGGESQRYVRESFAEQGKSSSRVNAVFGGVCLASEPLRAPHSAISVLP